MDDRHRTGGRYAEAAQYIAGRACHGASGESHDVIDPFTDGVVNVVTGAGRVAGERLAGHPDVAMMSFTGSTAVGRRVAAFVDEARGYATIVTRGDAPAGELAKGAYYQPTLIVDAPQDSTIVQREIFGPVLVVLPFGGDDEGLALAHDTPYGLAASAWPQDVYRSLRATREIKAGCVWVNDHVPIISEMPHGGYRASGYGKDMSSYSLMEHTQVKHVMQDITGVVRKDWHRTVFTDR